MTVELHGTEGVNGPTWTTAGRPASPEEGQQGYNSTLAQLEVYANGLWRMIAES